MEKSPWFYVFIVLLVIAALGSIFLVGAFFYAIRGILPPFLIALAIAWLLDPLLDRLQKHGVPRMAAVAGVYVLFLAAFVLAVIFLVPAIVRQAQGLIEDLPGQYARVKLFVGRFMEAHQGMLSKLRLPTTLEEAFSRYSERTGPYFEKALQALSQALMANISKLIWLILIPMSAFYFLSDFDRIKEKCILFVPERYRARVTTITSHVGKVFSSYVRGLIIACILYGISTTIVLSAFGLKYGIILGLIAGLIYAVPYVGPVVTISLVFLVGLATYQVPWPKAYILAGSMVVLNSVIFDPIVTPRIVGKSVGLHPVLSLFALVAGGHLWGPLGMVLAVPLAASIQEIVLEINPKLRGAQKKEREKAKKDRSHARTRGTG